MSKTEAAPSYLSADAKKIWREVVAHLKAQGTYKPIDGGVVESYAMALVRQRQLVQALDKAGIVGADGKPNGLLRTIEATATTVKNLAHVLGLDPLARKSMRAAGKGKTEGGTWAGVL